MNIDNNETIIQKYNIKNAREIITQITKEQSINNEVVHFRSHCNTKSTLNEKIK